MPSFLNINYKDIEKGLCAGSDVLASCDSLMGLRDHTNWNELSRNCCVKTLALWRRQSLDYLRW